MKPLRFWVAGTPAPKGSPQVITRGPGGRPLPYPRVVADSPATKAWQRAVAATALVVMRGRQRWDGETSLAVEVVFAFDSPASRYGTGRNAGKLKPGARVAPCVKPDLDKLLRSTLDGLNGHVFDDDARAVTATAWKIYPPQGQPEGACILVREAESRAVFSATSNYLETVWAELPHLRAELGSPPATQLEM